MRGGFTLVEVMVTASIMAVVLGGLAALMLGSHRLVKGAYAEAELSVQLRMLREKLLFHVAPPHGGKVWSGLLSGGSVNGASVIEGTTKIRMGANGIVLLDGSPCQQSIELVAHTELESDGSLARWFVNDGDRVDDQWQRKHLRPIEGYLADDWLDATVLAGNHVFFITLDAHMNGCVRRERISVPVFGTATAGGFDAD